MTIVEKAAYLKGLCSGLGVENESDNGKLWATLTDLLSDMAHEIEDLQSGSLDFADALDEFSDELSYLEEVTCDLDMPDCSGDCDSCDTPCGYLDDDEDDDDEDEEDDEEIQYDGVMYDVTCPVCGEEISFDEETLSDGSISCPNCGEKLEFDLGEENKD